MKWKHRINTEEQFYKVLRWTLPGVRVTHNETQELDVARKEQCAEECVYEEISSSYSLSSPSNRNGKLKRSFS